MSLKIDKNYIKWIIITIILGAVGSGLWEYMLKPIALSGTNFVLEIATLGITKYKNGLYEDIAQGLHEQYSLALLTFLLSFLPGLLLGLLSSTFFFPRPKSEEEKVRHPRNIFLFSSIFCLFLFTLTLVYTTRLSYTNRAVTHFNQLLTIAGPFLSHEDRVKQKALFAQILNREDYVNVLNNLRKVCAK